MTLTVVAVGKKHESWVLEGIERYQKRLRAPFNTEWVLLPHSSLDGDSARQEESERILARIKPQDYVVLLDERGKLLNSPELASLLTIQFTGAQKVTFVIGGAYGVTPEVQQRAQTVWSLSPLVFPHQLVRLLLIEQLYRAQQITAGSAYHHN